VEAPSDAPLAHCRAGGIAAVAGLFLIFHQGTALMRALLSSLSLVAFSLSLLALPGCGGRQEAVVAPRTADEVEAYKAEVYGAEEESQAEQQDDE
jgi:hypothetical protein